MDYEKKGSLLKVFLIFTLIFFFLNLIVASFSQLVNDLVNLFTMPYIIFCVIALVFFIKNKYSKITYTVPSLNILFMIFTIGIGVYSLRVSKIEFGLWWQVLIHLIYVTNILLSIYIIRKLKIKVF